jgi:hypothetical protein
MHPSEKIRRLEQLLARVSQRRAAPREPRLVLEQVTTPAALVAPLPEVIAEAPKAPPLLGVLVEPSRRPSFQSLPECGPCRCPGFPRRAAGPSRCPCFDSWE